MKKILSFLLAFVVLLSCTPAAYAVDDSREYFFALSVDGSDTKQVRTGDIITVTFHLNRTDRMEACDMYAMQNEIRYDSQFFRLVDGSILLDAGITATDIELRDNYRELYMNFVSMDDGESWEAQKLIGSFQLEVIAESGASEITNQDYLVSTADGMDRYAAQCQDVTIVVSTDCTVVFESNGGTKIPDQTVPCGSTIEQPEDPVRDGYDLEGWYSDFDLTEKWDFANDTVQSNITLYAKWQPSGAGEPNDGSDGKLWPMLLLGLFAVLVLILLLLFGRKTVKFDTGCSIKIANQKVRKGSLVEQPADFGQSGRVFDGWYRDAEKTIQWDFAHDKVAKNMTLYAKWNEI